MNYSMYTTEELKRIALGAYDNPLALELASRFDEFKDELESAYKETLAEAVEAIADEVQESLSATNDGYYLDANSDHNQALIELMDNGLEQLIQDLKYAPDYMFANDEQEALAEAVLALSDDQKEALEYAIRKDFGAATDSHIAHIMGTTPLFCLTSAVCSNFEAFIPEEVDRVKPDLTTSVRAAVIEYLKDEVRSDYLTFDNSNRCVNLMLNTAWLASWLAENTAQKAA